MILFTSPYISQQNSQELFKINERTNLKAYFVYLPNSINNCFNE